MKHEIVFSDGSKHVDRSGRRVTYAALEIAQAVIRSNKWIATAVPCK